MLMSAEQYRQSLRAYKPRVFVDGLAVDSVADSGELAPGIAAIGVTYDLALQPQYAELMTATNTAGRTVNRMIHIDESPADLLAKLEAVRLVCQESGCAQRYLSHDALSALHQATFAADAENGSDYHQRFLTYLQRIQAEDLTWGSR